MSMLKELDHLRIPLEAIKAATNNFGDGNFIGHGGFGKVYKGELSDSKGSKTVAVKRLDFKGDQGQQEFLTEIAMLSSYKHDNLVSLQGFCDEDVEKILVYEYMSRGSLDKYVSNTDSLTWVQRLKICIGAAHGLEYLHNHVGPQHRVIHRDIKSSNILLDHNWEAKISDFGLSKIGPANQQMTFLISNAAGTLGYCDPLYAKTGILTKESDVYSFGVVLFEVLCGRLACVGEYHDERRFLDQHARLCYKEKSLDGIIDQNLKKQMEPSSMNTFSAIAYRCLQKRRENRPEMALVVDELENALEFQLMSKVDRQIGADSNRSQMRVLLKSNSLEQHDLDLTCEKVLDDNDVDKKELSSFKGLMNRLCLCGKPPSLDCESGHNKDVNNSSKGDDFRKDRTLWFKDIGKYAGGEYSMAVIQANNVLEDQSQIESGDFGTFIGVYDGHGGPEAARYICDHLFGNFQRLAVKDQGIVTAELIKRAFLQTERGFTALVSELWSSRPIMAAVGSCCLVGVIYKSTLFVANLGDSRAVLGKKVDISGETLAMQLSVEHSLSIEGVRKELYDLHPHDSEVVVQKHNIWRVKGIIQISRSIGDVYMKHERFNREPLDPRFRLSEPLDMPYLSATPSIVIHPLEPSDSFVIFASDGLWENLSNQEAVDIVSSHPRSGSAKRLVEAALREAAKKREMKFSDIRRISKGILRHFLDDTTVIVLFLNHEFHERVSVRSALDH